MSDEPWNFLDYTAMMAQWVSEWLDLTHWGLVKPFGDIDLGQH